MALHPSPRPRAEPRPSLPAGAGPQVQRAAAWADLPPIQRSAACADRADRRDRPLHRPPDRAQPRRALAATARARRHDGGARGNRDRDCEPGRPPPRARAGAGLPAQAGGAGRPLRADARRLVAGARSRPRVSACCSRPRRRRSAPLKLPLPRPCSRSPAPRRPPRLRRPSSSRRPGRPRRHLRPTCPARARARAGSGTAARGAARARARRAGLRARFRAGAGRARPAGGGAGRPSAAEEPAAQPPSPSPRCSARPPRSPGRPLPRPPRRRLRPRRPRRPQRLRLGGGGRDLARGCARTARARDDGTDRRRPARGRPAGRRARRLPLLARADPAAGPSRRAARVRAARRPAAAAVGAAPRGRASPPRPGRRRLPRPRRRPTEPVPAPTQRAADEPATPTAPSAPPEPGQAAAAPGAPVQAAAAPDAPVQAAPAQAGASQPGPESAPRAARTVHRARRMGLGAPIKPDELDAARRRPSAPGHDLPPTAPPERTFRRTNSSLQAQRAAADPGSAAPAPAPPAPTQSAPEAPAPDPAQAASEPAARAPGRAAGRARARPRATGRARAGSARGARRVAAGAVAASPGDGEEEVAGSPQRAPIAGEKPPLAEAGEPLSSIQRAETDAGQDFPPLEVARQAVQRHAGHDDEGDAAARRERRHVRAAGARAGDGRATGERLRLVPHRRSSVRPRPICPPCRRPQLTARPRRRGPLDVPRNPPARSRRASTCRGGAAARVPAPRRRRRPRRAASASSAAPAQASTFQRAAEAVVRALPLVGKRPLTPVQRSARRHPGARSDAGRAPRRRRSRRGQDPP